MGLLTKAAAAVATAMGLTDQRLMNWATGGETHSGETVTVEKALQLDTVFACARLIATTIATLPIQLFERGDVQSKVADKHPLYSVIHDRPNPDMTAVEFWTAMVACMLLWGNSYALISRRDDGSVVMLEPLFASTVQVNVQLDGSMTYTHILNGKATVYQEYDILHLKAFSLDGRLGLSAVAFGRQSLGTSLAAERTAGRIFKNGMRPSGYLNVPQFLTTEQRQKTREYIKDFQGAENTGRVPMFEGGWTFTPLDIPPDDAQLLETRGFNVETICRWFGVPPMLVGHTEKTTTWGTGLEQINLGFLTYTLRSHLKHIEQSLGQKCLKPGEEVRYYAQFNVEALLRADSKGRSEYYRTMVQTGIMTPNEVRKLENLPPLPGGDKLLVQGAMMPVDLLVKQAEEALAIQKANRATAQLTASEPGVARDAAAIGVQNPPPAAPRAPALRAVQ